MLEKWLNQKLNNFCTILSSPLSPFSLISLLSPFFLFFSRISFSFLITMTIWFPSLFFALFFLSCFLFLCIFCRLFDLEDCWNRRPCFVRALEEVFWKFFFFGKVSRMGTYIKLEWSRWVYVKASSRNGVSKFVALCIWSSVNLSSHCVYEVEWLLELCIESPWWSLQSWMDSGLTAKAYQFFEGLCLSLSLFAALIREPWLPKY